MTEAYIGTVLHAQLSNYYGESTFIDDEAQEAWEALEVGDQVTAQRMFSTYIDEVEQEGLDVGQSTLTVENRWELEVGGVILSGKVDQIYFDEMRGGHVIRDHKTVGQFFQTSPVDYQLMCYAVLAQAHGVKNIVAIEHNQIKRNKRTASAKPPFINRTWQPTSDSAVSKFRQQLALQADEFAITMRHYDLEDPEMWAIGRNDCSYTCSFTDVCGMITSGEDFASVLEAEYIREAPVQL